MRPNAEGAGHLLPGTESGRSGCAEAAFAPSSSGAHLTNLLPLVGQNVSSAVKPSGTLSILGTLLLF